MGFCNNDRHVRGELFNQNGRWKYTVALDYTGLDWEHWDLEGNACKAFAQGKGVTMKEIPSGWKLVVLEPFSQFQHPIMVHGE